MGLTSLVGKIITRVIGVIGLCLFVTSCMSQHDKRFYKEYIHLTIGAIYSTKFKVVCFEDFKRFDGIFCIPAKDVNTKGIKPGVWQEI